ncbi:SpoIVB peptidase S55 domain-containing protein [Paludisphaera mucosa]|uniref:SpoIVB peptidase S55 domain-containing protein n=1 Tax=Paludisphaera mucosa TaxID=3030827 RepID=A0ABT6F6I0_9BACT|nr:SpoIVB peptidase S55 domain-containing protein [Paludisphaera mucosa]MDG3003019.1 SpoIVB peptidase S55 domain-containing protein [Paludisphaera mucosa]
MRSMTVRRGGVVLGMGWALALLGASTAALAGEPDAKTYWDVKDLRPGMKGVGQTVMVGTKLEEFGAEVLGVMRDVSPGRDMVLCRLTGCNLEHAGIIQGMSGSPIYIDGKLVGAVAFAWEFAKDPIAGVTPFQQMVQYVRASDRKVAAEARDKDVNTPIQASVSYLMDVDGPIGDEPAANRSAMPLRVSGGGAGMIPIATPLAASGFSPRALAMLDDKLRPLGMAPMSGGRAGDEIVRGEGDKPLAPGSPLSIAMVMGDFDLSGIGTVTHVEGDRVYGFGHPMFSLGNCEFPMMTGYIHTVYPRASVSMKMGSPLKVVGVVDADVSTGVAGRVGAKPDMLPMTVRVKTGKYADAHTYKVQMVREPSLTSSLMMSVLTSAIDTEGNLPEELTARLKAEVHLHDRETIVMQDTFSGPRYTGQMGASALFGPLSSIVNILVKNPMAPVRIESIDCDVEIEDGRRVATIESVRLQSVTVEPGQTLRAFVTLKPYKGEREVVEAAVKIPGDFPEGNHEAVVCDLSGSARRRFRNDPVLNEPRDLQAILASLKMQTEPKRTEVYLHVQTPDRGLAVNGESLPNLPASARAAFGSKRQAPASAIRSDLIQAAATPWVVEGNQTLQFTVAKDAGLSLSLK